MARQYYGATLARAVRIARDGMVHVDRSASRLQVLITDYEQAREEERHYASQQTTLIAITFTAVTIAAAVLFSSGAGEIRVADEWHDLVYFIAPLLAVVPLLFLIHIGTTAVWRSYYLRALEREIRTLIVATDLRDVDELPPLSYAELYVAESAGRGSGSPGALKVLVSATYPIILLVVGGLAVAMTAQIHALPLRLLMFFVYGAGALGLLGHVARVHIYGREVFEVQVGILQERLTTGLGPIRDRKSMGRTPFSYFVLPRPDELLTKSLFIGLGLLFAVAQLPGMPAPEFFDWVNVGLLWVAVELLLYQARYQWNDILGMAEDQRSPAARKRGRLPAFTGGRALSWVIILVRLYLVVVLLSVPFAAGRWSMRMVPAILLAAVLVGSSAVLYELVRWWLRTTKHASAFQLALLCTVVGFGYVARLTIGYVALGGPLTPTFAAGAVAVWALGVYFVTVTWLIEATWNYNWGAKDETRSTARRQLHNPDDSKPHLTALLRRTGVTLPVSKATASRFNESKRVDLLLRHLPRVPVLPVGLAAAVWLFVGGAAGARLVGLPFDEWSWHAAAAGTLAAIVAVIPALGASQWWKLSLAALPLISTFTTLFVLAQLSDPVDIARLVVLNAYALVPLILFVSFSGMNYDESRALVARIANRSGQLVLATYDFASGVDPRSRLARSKPAKSPVSVASQKAD